MTVLVVGVVFSPGGKVYSFDPDGLELHWNDKVICQTARGLELRPRGAERPRARRRAGEPLRKIVRRAGQRDDETVRTQPRASARLAVREFREILRESGHAGVRPLAAEIVVRRRSA